MVHCFKWKKQLVGMGATGTHALVEVERRLGKLVVELRRRFDRRVSWQLGEGRGFGGMRGGLEITCVAAAGHHASNTWHVFRVPTHLIATGEAAFVPQNVLASQ